MTDLLVLTLGVLSYTALWATTLGAFKPLSIERSGVYILVTGLGAGLVFGMGRFVEDGRLFQALGLMLAESAYLALVLFLRSVRQEFSRRSEVLGSVVVLVLTMVHLTLNLTLQGLWHYGVLAVQILVLFSLALREAVLVYRNRPNGITRMLVILLSLHLALEAVGRAYMGYQFVAHPEGSGTEWLEVRAAWTYITFSLGYVVLTATASVLMDAFRTDKFRLEQVVQQIEGRLRDKEAALMALLLGHAEKDKDPGMATLAHELRQPLHSIQLNAEYLTSGKTISRAEETEILQTILRENQRAADLVQGLRNIFVNKVPAQLSSMPLSTWLNDWVQARAPGLLKDKGIALQLHAQSGLKIKAHAAQIEVILQNLVLNAEQALAGHPRGSIDLSLISQGKLAQIDVIDNGPGIDRAVAEKIFDMGYTTRSEGMGMGLWLCRRIAEMHGGQLINIPTAQGTHMRLTLPLFID